MRSKRWAATAATAAALAAVPAAGAGMMHATLGARLSGMGEHGVVDVHAHAKTHKLCWTFDLHLKHALDATVRDKQGTVVARLGHMFSAKGCAKTPKQSLSLIEAKPGHYWVWVATKGHPGEVRGKLSAGMAHM